MHIIYQIKHSSNQNVIFQQFLTSEEGEESKQFLLTSWPPDQPAVCSASDLILANSAILSVQLSAYVCTVYIHLYIHSKEWWPIIV